MKYLKAYESLKNGDRQPFEYHKDYSETSIDLDELIGELEDLGFDINWIQTYLRKLLVGKFVSFHCNRCTVDEYDDKIHKRVITQVNLEENYDHSIGVNFEYKGSDGDHRSNSGILVRDYKYIDDPEINKRQNQAKFDL